MEYFKVSNKTLVISMGKISMDENCIAFTVGIKNNLSDKDLVFEAVKKAYSDMSRRTLFFENSDYIETKVKNEEYRNNLKKDISDIIYEKSKKICNDLKLCKSNKQHCFNEWHDKVCLEIIKIFTTPRDGHTVAPMKSAEDLLKSNTPDACKLGFSYGQAQKILNMSIKYLYIFCKYYEAKKVQGFASISKEFDNLVPYLHSPVDGLVIGAAKKKTVFGLQEPQQPWSQMDKDVYIAYEKELRKKCENTSEKNPFIWELVNYPFN